MSDRAVVVPLSGVGIGHWTDPMRRTGCTVVLLPPGSVASGEVRGGAPATREFALLEPTRLVQHVDAVVLAGGSAFGLAAADGVASVCLEHGRGFETPASRVPIVVGMALFDLLAPERTDDGPPPGGVVAPGRAEGMVAARAAFASLRDAVVLTPGRVGAGAGATIGKWRGREHARPGGLGVALVRRDDVAVLAVFGVNAAGDIDDGSARAAIAAGTFTWPSAREPFADEAIGNTTIGVVITNAPLDKVQCRLVAESGHDGLARALFPAHGRSDGDAIVAASTGASGGAAVTVPVDVVRSLAAVAVEQAVRSIV
jgi:L-aminopeptidase/D-esterase-like protein